MLDNEDKWLKKLEALAQVLDYHEEYVRLLIQAIQAGEARDEGDFATAMSLLAELDGPGLPALDFEITAPPSVDPRFRN